MRIPGELKVLHPASVLRCNGNIRKTNMENEKPNDQIPKLGHNLKPLKSVLKNILQPLGIDKKPLSILKPTLIGICKAQNLKKKPDDEKYAAERVVLFAKEQLTCPQPFKKIEAKRITDNMYRVNFLADDIAPPKDDSCGPKPRLSLITTKRVYSAMVRVVWGKQLILTAIPGTKTANNTPTVDDMSI